ncbi:MAG: ATP-binding protein [Eubacterium sp.]|nr:ATP-binding protein [Eubacterium sp.]
MAEYYKRYIEKTIEKKLKSCGAVVVEGPKFCGKTTTALRYAKSQIRLNTSSSIELAKLETRNVLRGEKPRVIDEWQTVPDIWNEVKGWIDENPAFGQFILTGSSTPADKSAIYHSGAGRITTVKMKPMSLSESRESKETVSLKELFENKNADVFDENKDSSLEKIAHILCRGGWPLSVVAGEDISLDVTKNYYEGLFNFEYCENEKFRNKNPELMRMILKSYARNISTEAPLKTIQSDVINSNNRTLDNKTLIGYTDALKDLFIIEDMEAWNPNLRSKAATRTTPTRHFVDTSVATSVLGISPQDLMSDLNSFGLFFEDMAVRDLNIYSSIIGGTVGHYRDSSGLECDAVIHLENGKWAAFEIKLGGEKLINEGAANLEKFKNTVAEENLAFRMILTAKGPAYKRKDGIFVVPIDCLTA